MRLLLPPSETKHRGGRGRPLWAQPPHPQLAEGRAQALAALEQLLRRRPEEVATALLLPPGVVAESLAANAAVLDSATTPALRRYAGTVYDGIAWAELDEPELRLLARTAFVFSGLLGVARGDEPVPVYRVPAKARLPGLGVAAAFWRPRLDAAMPAVLGRAPGLIVDLRSSDYAAMWRPGRDLAPSMVRVRVLSPLPGGGRGVVSAASKHAKGRLAAALARRVVDGEPVESAEDVARAWLACGGPDAEPGPTASDGAQPLAIHTETATLPGTTRAGG